MAVDSLTPSPENDTLYKLTDPRDPEIVALAKSIRRHGILEPLIATVDGYLVSGHRRHCAAGLAHLERVPCRVLPIRREDDPAAFVRLLREYNRQREKTLDEKLREEVVSITPGDAAAVLYEYRRAKAAIDPAPLKIVGTKRRKRISRAKLPFLGTIQAIIDDQQRYWPLSDRRIHYALLNDPPLIHASKPASTYQNDVASYKAAVDLLTRARLDGSIPFEAIGDETRPVSVWDTFPSPRGFVRREMDNVMLGYCRNLMQSQPNHIEILGEKNTVAPIIKPVAAEYTIPLTTGRGYCSLPPRRAMAERYATSGKETLVLLIVSDFDPEGEDIAHSFAQSMRDDFGIAAIHPIKVALTSAQARDFGLVPTMKAKAGSSRRAKFVDRHGDDVYELEALQPAMLQNVLREAIEGVIDGHAYRAEIDAERQDAAWLHEKRQRVLAAMASAEPGDSC